MPDEALILNEEQRILLDKIKDKCKEYNIPVKENESSVLFGGKGAFFLFWISNKESGVTFSARKRAIKEKIDNMERIPFIPENERDIIAAIDALYSDIESRKSGKFKLDDVIEHKLTAILERIRSAIDDGLLPPVRFKEDRLSLISRLGDDLLALLSPIASSVGKNAEIFNAYYDSDTLTLEEIGKEKGVTRERIRQLNKSNLKRIRRSFDRYMTFCSYPAEIRDGAADILEKIEPCEFIVLLYYGANKTSKRKKLLISSLLLGESYAAPIKKLFDEYSNRINKKTCADKDNEKEKLIPGSERRIIAWKKLEEKICFPTSPIKIDRLDFISFEPDINTNCEKRLKSKLDSLLPLIEYVEYPDIVYYSSTTTDHRPDFAIKTPENQCVLVITLPTINLAYNYNLTRFNALHSFCRKNGYGYIVMNDRGKSIYDIKAINVDEALKARLDEILDKRTMIIWSDILKLKEEFKITNETVVAYVLQNNLSFNLKPFTIRKKQ